MAIQLNCGTGSLTGAPKKLEFNKFLYEVQPDIVLLQETWFSDKKNPHFNGFSMVNMNHSKTYKTTGGGVAIIIRESAGIKYTPLPDLTAPDDECTDIIQAKLKWTGRELVVISLYNPPVTSRPKDR